MSRSAAAPAGGQLLRSDAIVWDTHSGDAIIWGTLGGGDTVVWGN